MTESGPRLEPGDIAPDFNLLNQDSTPVSLSRTLAGKPSVLYFYPAAASPGCSKEASDFQESLEDFTKAGFQIVGISPDDPAKLKSFEESHDLTFELLSDPALDAHKAYGAFGEKNLYGRLYKGVLRSTVVVDENAKVLHALYNVKATGHVNMLKKLLGIAG